jgi:hypothetical protein
MRDENARDRYGGAMSIPVPVDVLDNWVDYVTLVIALLASGGTLLAVYVSLRTAKAARLDSARDAAAREDAQDRLIRHDQELAEWRDSQERERFDREHATTARDRALRQADMVTAGLVLTHTSNDLFGGGDGFVSNQSDAAITDVWFTYMPGYGLEGYPFPETSSHQQDLHPVQFPVIEAHQRMEFPISGYLGVDVDREGEFIRSLRVHDAGFRVTFTDRLGDKWELQAGDHLRLLNPKHVF